MACLIMSIYLMLSLSLFLPSTFVSIVTFPRDSSLLTMWPEYDSLIWASRENSGLIWSKSHLLVFVVVHHIYEILPPNHISNESTFFLSACFNVQHSHTGLCDFKCDRSSSYVHLPPPGIQSLFSLPHYLHGRMTDNRTDVAPLSTVTKVLC